MSAIPTFSFSTTADEVATAFAQQIKGKNILITGTSINGIGFETARVIAKLANLVIITGYNDERLFVVPPRPRCYLTYLTFRLRISEQAIKKDVPAANIRLLTLDLSSLAGIRKAAAEVNTYAEPLHVLIHNAAATLGMFKVTVDNLESQIATDHISPFLLTKLLTPKLLASSTAEYTPRVVFVSSGVHAFGDGVNFHAMEHPSAEGYTALTAYSSAKSANILTAIELSRRSKGKLNAYSLHPGIIFTNIYQHPEAIPGIQALGILSPDDKPNEEKIQWKTIPQGASTTVAAAFDPRISDQPGSYLEDSAIANNSIAAHSSNPANAQKLWALTEKIIGETFTF